MSFKLLASDLDGTLLNSASVISEENLKAIQELQAMGILFVPCTGRAYSELHTELKNNPDIRYYICSGGAVTYDKLTGEALGEYISADVREKILDAFANFICWKIIHYGNSSVTQTSEVTKERMNYYGLHPYLQDVAVGFSKKVDDIDHDIRNIPELEMVAACFRAEEEAILCQEMLEKISGINVLRGTMGHGIHNVEMVSGRASKGDMLLKLADHLNIPHGDVMSVGDSTNDLSMIKAVKNSFAVANANREVKSWASAVICSNDDHAIKYILESYIKPSERL